MKRCEKFLGGDSYVSVIRETKTNIGSSSLWVMGSLVANWDNSRYHGICVGASNNNDARVYRTGVFHGDYILVEEWKVIRNGTRRFNDGERG